MTAAEKLSQAEAAYHSLMMGQMAAVFVDQNGERVEYRATQSHKLKQYIQDLKDEISGATSARPARMIF